MFRHIARLFGRRPIRPIRNPGRIPKPFRPRLEGLEAREVPAVLTAIPDTFAVLPNTPTVLNVLANDPSAAQSKVDGFTQPSSSQGSVTRNADGTLTFTPASGFSGTSFSYAITPAGGQAVLPGPTTPTIGDGYGYAVAISDDGNTAAVSRRCEPNSPGSADNPGEVVILVRSGSGWVKQAEVTASVSVTNPATPDDLFGASLALSADGNTLAIGMPGGSGGFGDVFVLRRTTSTGGGVTTSQWDFEVDLSEPRGFGNSVALSNDGNTLAIGSTDRKAYVFTRTGASWSNSTTLQPSDGSPNDGFGEDVAVSGDGKTVLVGARGATVNGLFQAGKAYVFSGAAGWPEQVVTEQSQLTASDPGANAFFGRGGLGLDDTGDLAVVGAPGVQFGGASSGAAYVFHRSGTSWTQQQILRPEGSQTGGEFGQSLALSGDGSTVFVGAHSSLVGTLDSGGAGFVFVRSGSGWAMQEVLTSPTPTELGFYAQSVAVSRDGTTLLAGEIGAAAGNATNGGKAYFLDRATAGVTLTVQAPPANHPPTAGDDAVTVAAGSTNNPVGVLGNDADPDGDPLTVTAVGPAGHGGTVLSGGRVLYTPAAGYSGPDSFNYTVADGRGGTAQATVRVTVAAAVPAPTAAGQAVTTNQDTARPVTLSSTDPNGDPLSFAVVPGSGPAHGTLSGSGPNLTYTPAPGYSGPDRFLFTATDQATGLRSSPATVSITVAPVTRPPVAGSPLVVGGSGDGSAVVYTPTSSGRYSSSPVTAFSPFGEVGTSVRTAAADVDGDGVADAVLVTGPGTPLRFAVVSGKDGSLLVSPTDPFGGDFLGGGFVAAADLDHDGRAEVMITPDQGGGPRVTVFSLVNGNPAVRANFFGIDDPDFRGGARVAAGDVNGDGTPDLVVAAGFGGGPRVALFDGRTVLGGPAKLTGDFFAFPGSDAVTLRNGVFVAAGDVDGDGKADLVFGGGPGGAPRVLVLSGARVAVGDVGGAQTAPVANFFVGGDVGDRGGVRVAAVDPDGNGRADVAVGSGEGSPSRIRVYPGTALKGGEPGQFQDLDPFGSPLTDGVFVG